MTDIKIEELNKEFKEIWLRNKGIPQAMSKWQEKLEAFVNKLEPTNENRNVLSSYVDEWQEIMRKNKELLVTEKTKLQDKIKKGEPTFLKTKNADKFKDLH